MSYIVGVDGVSWSLIALTLVVNLIIILSMTTSIQKKPTLLRAIFMDAKYGHRYFLSFRCCIILYVLGRHVDPDVSLYRYLGIQQSIICFYEILLYTFIGSLLMLAGMVYLGIQASSFCIFRYDEITIKLS